MNEVIKGHKQHVKAAIEALKKVGCKLVETRSKPFEKVMKYYRYISDEPIIPFISGRIYTSLEISEDNVKRFPLDWYEVSKNKHDDQLIADKDNGILHSQWGCYNKYDTTNIAATEKRMNYLEVINKMQEDLNKYSRKWSYKQNNMKLKEAKVKAEGLTEVKRKVKDDKLIVTFKERKSLIDYIKEYYQNKDTCLHEILYKDSCNETSLHNERLIFENRCGIMKLICDDLNSKTQELRATGFSTGFYIINNGKEFIPCDLYNYLSPFKFNTISAAQKAIDICGTKFLKKLYQRD